MRKLFSFHFLIRGIALSFVIVGAFVLHSRLLECRWDMAFCTSLSGCVSLLMMYPVSDANVFETFKFCLLSYVMMVALLFVRCGIWLYPVLYLLFLELFIVWKSVRKYSQLRLLFRNVAVWQETSDFSMMFYSVTFAVAVSVFESLLCAGLSLWPEVILLSVLVIVSYLRDLTGHTFFLDAESERSIKEMVRGNLRGGPAEIDRDQSARMGRMYSSLLSIMESKRPYLNPDLGSGELASLLLTNKNYLSKTVNMFSGRNIPQFVNYFRINHAIEIMKKNPNLKIMEVASMSGFNSVVSFNMAFKLNTGDTPSEYVSKLKLKKLE